MRSEARVALVTACVLVFIIVLAACSGSAGAPAPSGDASRYASSDESAAVQETVSGNAASSETVAATGTATASASSEQYAARMGETASDLAGSEQYTQEAGEGTTPIPSDGQQAIEGFPEFTPAPADVRPPVLGGPEGKPLEPFLYEVGNDLDRKWGQQFAYEGYPYTSPSLEVFTETQLSIDGCDGVAERSTGPFYCSDNHTIYFPANWVEPDSGKTLEEYGDFAIAYGMAHEFSHHVQNLLGILQRTYSIQHELQADCLAGAWATTIYYEGQLETGDIEEAISLIADWGDVPGTPWDDPTAHGSSEQRLEWFSRGYQTGDISQCRTY